MNKRNRAQASSLFLLELTMAILFFSIASAVCVQIFVKSRAMSLHAEELNAAVREVSSAAEIVRASKSRAEAEEMIRSFYRVLWQPDLPGEICADPLPARLMRSNICCSMAAVLIRV